jgi:hypothetical protein
MNILCFDNGGESFDRYTIVYLDTLQDGFYECRGSSAGPYHPQGFAQMSECKIGDHLGRRVSFSNLPVDVQHLVNADLNYYRRPFNVLPLPKTEEGLIQ